MRRITIIAISLVVLATWLCAFNAENIQINENEELEIKTGTIDVDGQSYSFQKSFSSLEIYDPRGYLAFQWQSDNKEKILLDFGYSHNKSCFIVFEENFEPETQAYTFKAIGSDLEVSITDKSSKASYSPIIVKETDSSIILAYIEEGSSLIYFDLYNQQEVYRQKFEKPIFGLSKGILQNEPALTFKQFDGGKILNLKRSLKGDSPHKKPILPIDKPSEPESEATEQRDESLPGIHYPAAVDPKTIVGFGDSITYGKISSTPVPHLGYVPRLERMVNEHFYPDADGRVINEGIPGEQVIEGVLRLEDKVLRTYMGKYLLFHEGTNDCIHLEYSVDLVNTTIEYMMDVTLQYGIQPIISTLIPRDISYPNVTARHIERGKKISEFIRQLATEKNLPMVDFWEIFLNHPDGYKSLMGDYVHPGEKGYQLMAEEWLKALQGLEPPSVPTGIEIIERTPVEITIQWQANIETDFDHYVLEYGFTPETMNHTVTTTGTYHKFYYNILQSPFRSRIYFRLQAVDKAGKSSPFSQVHTAAFLTFSHWIGKN